MKPLIATQPRTPQTEKLFELMKAMSLNVKVPLFLSHFADNLDMYASHIRNSRHLCPTEEPDRDHTIAHRRVFSVCVIEND